MRWQRGREWCIERLIQASGFLYQIADSSINVISNVQTAGTPVTTTFNNYIISFHDPSIYHTFTFYF